MKKQFGLRKIRRAAALRSFLAAGILAALCSGAAFGSESEAAFSGSEEAASGNEAAFSGSEEAAFGNEAAFSGSEEAASGNEEVSSGSEAATSDNKVASSDEMVTAQEVTTADMVPVKADELKEGSWEIKVNSSSSMFEITSCILTVADGEMSAKMYMGGTGYLYVYMGNGEEAAAASEEEYIPFEEQEDGVHTFTVPVKELDCALDCAAFSRRKEKWYERKLCFVAESLPEEAFSEPRGTMIEDLGLEDGSYTAEVALGGGSGRASVTSPAKIEVKDGEVTAEIEWSSSKYDYMVVDSEKYLPVNTSGNSVFVIPVSRFDSPVSVTADTTAMSKPYEIEYTLTFDSKTLEKN